MIEADKNINALLTTHGLTIGYRDGRKEYILLNDLNLSLYKGQLVCFMGPNGIGKSTLIRNLAGLEKPLHGEVKYVDERELSKMVAVVLTDKVTATHLTVYELITFGRYPFLDWTVKINAKNKKIIDAAIEKVNIAHLTHKRLYQLSDGQLQMAMIARALTQDADIILLDEPTAHLDLNNRVEIMNVLRKLSRDTNKAILVATHELDLALQMADNIWLAGNNKDILTGIPEDLVLNGVFDEIFQFKGFDLKTGKVHQDAHRGVHVKVIGSDHEYRWTKNALERNGFVVDESADTAIQILKTENKTQWLVSKDQQKLVLTSLADVIKAL